MHLNSTPQDCQCCLRASYLKLDLHLSHLKSVLFSYCMTKRFTFLPKLSLLLQLGHVLFLCYHCAMHGAQQSWLHSWHSFGSSTTCKQIVQVKYWSNPVTTCSALRCFSRNSSALPQMAALSSSSFWGVGWNTRCGGFYASTIRRINRWILGLFLLKMCN